jgi:hypothetical protein
MHKLLGLVEFFVKMIVKGFFLGERGGRGFVHPFKRKRLKDEFKEFLALCKRPFALHL